MARQTRQIYMTGNAELDRILNDISARLDIIEGLRPDLSAGYYNLDSSKNIDTDSTLTSLFYPLVDRVSIGENFILITSASGNSIYIDATYIEIKDANGDVIHKIGSWT